MSTNCDGKKKRSKKGAEKELRKRRKDRKNENYTYYCYKCGYYHLTSVSPEHQKDIEISRIVTLKKRKDSMKQTNFNFNHKCIGTANSDKILTATLRDVIAARNNGSIIEYSHNRGEKGLKSKRMRDRIRKIAEIFEVESMGEINMRKGKQSYELADAHTRLAAAHFAYDNEWLEEKDLNSTVVIRLIPSDDATFIKRYEHLNNNEPHNSDAYITNPHTTMGKLVQEVVGEESEENTELITKFGAQIGRLAVMGIENPDLDWDDCLDTFPVLIKSSILVKDINKYQVDYDTSMSRNKMRKLRSSLNFVLRVREELQSVIEDAENRDVYQDKVVKSKKVLAYAPFFGACLIGAMASPDRRRFIFGNSECPETIAERIFKRIESLIDCKLEDKNGKKLSVKLSLGQKDKEAAEKLRVWTKDLAL